MYYCSITKSADCNFSELLTEEGILAIAGAQICTGQNANWKKILHELPKLYQLNVHKYRLHGKGAQRCYSSLQANFSGTLSTMI